MGLRDTEEMLEVAKAECVRLEKALAAIAELHSHTRRIVMSDGYAETVCMVCDKPAPCRTLRLAEAPE